MQVTNVVVRMVEKGGSNFKAFAEVTFDHQIKIHGVRVLSGKKGLFVAMPQREAKNKEGKVEYYPYVSLDSDEARREFSQAVLAEYNRQAK